MSTLRPWSAEIATYFQQLDGTPPTDQFNLNSLRLPNGPHWGIIPGFNPETAGGFDLETRTDTLLNEASERGASVARAQMDWAELEVAPGVYDQQLLDEFLSELARYGQAGFVTLSTLDSDGLTLPAYLLDPETGRLRDGLSLTSREIRQSFEDFLDWLVPQLTNAGVWGVSIGNEVEIPVEDGIVSSDEAAQFLEDGLAHLKSIDPEMIGTVTLTLGAAGIAPDLTSRIAEASDIFTVNFYGDNADGLPGPEDWNMGLEIIKDMADGKPIFFQELGMPVGYTDAGLPGESRVNSSLETQDAFFAFMGREIANDPQLLGATVFQLYDWSLEVTETFLDGLESDFFAGFAEALATIGLVAWSDGTTRPAWDTWLQALDTAEVVRGFHTRLITEGDATRDVLRLDATNGDVVFAKAGNDRVRTGDADDAVDLGSGRDRANTGAGDDVILGRGGNDVIRAGSGEDWAEGGSGADRLLGNRGSDHLSGGQGADRLFAGRGDDTLLGGSEDDILRGGPGEDLLNGQSGNDTLIGGAGADVFVFEEGGGRDEIRYFNIQNDLIFLEADLAGNALTGAEVVDQFGDNGSTLVFGKESLTFTGIRDLVDLAESIVLF